MALRADIQVKIARFIVQKRDPITVALTVIGVCITLLIAFELAKGLHRFHGTYSPPLIEKQAVAGFLAAEPSPTGFVMHGWAPPKAAIHIMDHDKLMASGTADDVGQWAVVLPFEKKGHNFHALTAVYEEKDLAPVDLGDLYIFISAKSSDDVYAWWESDATPRLLGAPENVDEGDLVLSLSLVRDQQNPIYLGRGTPGSLIQLYIDNDYKGEATVLSDGFWTLTSTGGTDKKASLIRFDELQGQDVIERRLYHLEGGEEKDAWHQDLTPQHQKAHIALIMHPETGELLPADELEPGQIIPLITPKPMDMYR